MININKNTLIIIVVLAVVIGGALIFLSRGLDQKERLIIEQDLIPIELSQEEQQALQDEGLQISSGEDALAKDLQSVRSSDELGAIEADLSETDLSGLDKELEVIESDLSGL